MVEDEISKRSGTKGRGQQGKARQASTTAAAAAGGSGGGGGGKRTRREDTGERPPATGDGDAHPKKQTRRVAAESSETPDVSEPLDTTADVPGTRHPGAVVTIEGTVLTSIDLTYIGDVVTTVDSSAKFEDAATFYERVTEVQDPDESDTCRFLVKLTLNQFEPDERPVVMDACCGKGGDLGKWGRRVSEVYAIDNSRPTLELLQRRVAENRCIFPPKVHTCKIDMGKLQYGSKFSKYQAVSCMFALNYMDSAKGQLKNCLLNMCSAMDEGGFLVMVYTNKSAVDGFENTADCRIERVSESDHSLGYNFRLGKLVDAVE